MNVTITSSTANFESRPIPYKKPTPFKPAFESILEPYASCISNLKLVRSSLSASNRRFDLELLQFNITSTTTLASKRINIIFLDLRASLNALTQHDSIRYTIHSGCEFLKTLQDWNLGAKEAVEEIDATNAKLERSNLGNAEVEHIKAVSEKIHALVSNILRCTKTLNNHHYTILFLQKNLLKYSPEQTSYYVTHQTYAIALEHLLGTETQLHKFMGKGSYGEVVSGSISTTRFARKSSWGDPSSVQCLNNEMAILPLFPPRSGIIQPLLVCAKEGVLYTELGSHSLEGRVLLTNKDAIDFLNQVLLGLSHLEAQGILHNDIKPGNIVYLKKQGFKVIDFGKASQNTPVSGTIAFTAPEILNGSKGSKKNDLWSLGATLFELCVGDHLSDALMMQYNKRDAFCFELNSYPKYLKEHISQLDVDQTLKHYVAKLPEIAQQLLPYFLQVCPSKRPSATEILRSGIL